MKQDTSVGSGAVSGFESERIKISSYPAARKAHRFRAQVHGL